MSTCSVEGGWLGKNRSGKWEWVRVGARGGVLIFSPLLLGLVCWELANKTSFVASVNGRLVLNCSLDGEDGCFVAVRGIAPGWGHSTLPPHGT